VLLSATILVNKDYYKPFLPETTVPQLHFSAADSMGVSSFKFCGRLRKTGVWRNSVHNGRSRSYKVIDFGIDRKRVYDVLWPCYIDHILHCFGRYAAAYLEIWKRGVQGVHFRCTFQKCFNFSIIFFTLKTNTIFFTSKGRPYASPPPKYATVGMRKWQWMNGHENRAVGRKMKRFTPTDLPRGPWQIRVMKLADTYKSIVDH